MEATQTHAQPVAAAATPDDFVHSGIACLAMLLRFHQLAADPRQIAREHAPERRDMDFLTLVRAAKQLGLKARAVKVKAKRLAHTPLPAIAQFNDGGYAILARVSGAKALLQRPGQSPQEMRVGDLVKEWSGFLMLATTAETLAGARRKFDITWFIPVIAKYRKLLGEVLLASFFLQLFGLITPLFFQVVVDKVLVHRGLVTLNVLVIGLLAIILFETLLGGLRTYLFSHTTSRVDVELGARLFKHLLALPVNYFESRQTGQTVARVRELENIRDFITGSALTVIMDLLFTVVFLIVMWHYSPTLTLIVLGAIPFYAGLSVAITPALRARVEEKFQRGAANQAFLVESVTGIETLKSMAVEPQMRARWERQLAGYVRASFRLIVLSMLGSQSVQFISKVVMALILWSGAHQVIQGELSIGQLIAFNMLAGQVSGPVLRLAQLWQDFQQFRISIARLGDILNNPAEPGHNPNRPALPALRGRIQFERVTFAYHACGGEALRDLDLEIPEGTVAGLVGRSGSGKSTIAKLLQRLHAPGRGRVLIDRVDLTQVDPAWLRRQIGVVLQENILFNRSVRDNIALTMPSASIERVMECAEMAGAHEFILELPHGYDTLLEERGTNLSGGQRQRIAIARALIADPRILIFDEATSALDYESERIIQNNMRAICRERTVLVIAHRLSTVRMADEIFVIDKGRVVERGAHDELLSGGGFYARLHNAQSSPPSQALCLPA